jgi:Ca2+-binding RTX toxin-like protein
MWIVQYGLQRIANVHPGQFSGILAKWVTMQFSAHCARRSIFCAGVRSAGPRTAQPKLRRAVAEALEPRTLLSASLWDTSVTPALTSFSDANSVEVGVRFRSQNAGYVTGLRFYKGAGNTGTHVGHLWNASGTLLGSATFTQESGAGWQEISFASPIHIDANTSYIASCFDPNGHYAVDAGYFASTSVDNPPLHAPLDASSTGGEGNGVFALSTSGDTFPAQTFSSNNYWVDVLFDATLAPQVTDTTPAFHATYVDPSASATVTFSVPMDPASINSANVFLRGPGNVPVPATVSYDAGHRIATIDPTGTLALNATYTIVAKGGAAGVKSAGLGGIALASDSTSTFRVQPNVANTLWPASTTPSVTSFNDPTAAELGVRFRTDVDGVVTGIRFYKGAGNTGTHTGTLWTNDGHRIATATFTDETDMGWQQVTFDSPVVVPAGTTLIASYLAPNGHYAADVGYFATTGVDSGPLHAPRDGTDGLGNGVYAQPSSGGVFPASTTNSNNYWVDVVFFQGPLQQPNSPPTATPQAVSVNENDKAVINLAAQDAESAQSDLTFRIDTLPTGGVLKYNGLAVTAGQTFTGPPANLTYEPGAEVQAGTTDAFTFHAVDPEGLASDPATVSINVNKAVADGAVALSGGVLLIGGTAGDDVITVSRTPTGKFRVTFGLKVVSDTIPVAGVSEIRIWGRQGCDAIALVDVNTRALISGGDGNDIIGGGNLDDLLLGGNGDDALTGFAGNDVIAGGAGHDALFGMDGHDVLIAGSIAPLTTASDLRAVGIEWALSKATTAQEAATADQVVTDTENDVLSGGAGSDWFIVSKGDGVLDYSTKTGSADVITYVS